MDDMASYLRLRTKSGTSGGMYVIFSPQQDRYEGFVIIFRRVEFVKRRL